MTNKTADKLQAMIEGYIAEPRETAALFELLRISIRRELWAEIRPEAKTILLANDATDEVSLGDYCEMCEDNLYANGYNACLSDIDQRVNTLTKEG